MRFFERLLPWSLFVVVATAAWGVGSPAVTVIDVTGAAEQDRSFAFRVQTPAVFVGDQDGGFTDIEIKGFGARERRPGAPDIPTHIVLVALPAGAVPRIEVRPLGERLRPGLLPRPVPTRRARSHAQRETAKPQGERGRPRTDFVPIESFVRDESIYGGNRTYPEQVAWLGEIGVLRSQRYVEVHLAPVRFDPAAGALRVHDAVEVTVHFDGAEAGGARQLTTDPQFESVYRSSIANYSQGLGFRLDAQGAAIEPAATAGRGATVGPCRRIRVHQHGMVRLDHALFDSEFLAADVSTWKLTNRGVAVPLQIQDDGNGILEPGEWVQFWGQALDDEPKTALNTPYPPPEPSLYEARDFTDVNVYFLSHDPAAQPAIPSRDATPTFSRVPPAHFTELARAEVDDGYRPLAENDPWYWLPSLSANGSTPLRSVSLDLPGLYDGTMPVQVRAWVRGLTEDDTVDPDHVTRLTLKNSASQELTFEESSFDARVIHEHLFSWTHSGSGPLLSSPAEFDLEALVVPGAANDVILDWIELSYQREFAAIGDALVFDWPDADAEFVVAGLLDSQPEVYEITLGAGEQVIQPVRLAGLSVTGAGPYDLRFRVDNDPGTADGAARRFAVVGAGALIAPAGPDFTADTVSDLRDQQIQADFIVLAHPDVLDATPGGPLDNLLAHRASAAGGSLTSKIVMLEDVEDEFNDGLPGPLAVKEFLRWVMSTAPGEGWASPKPSYLLILGDGSFDYKGGVAAGNFVPTQIMFKDVIQLGYYASDNVMASVVGADPLPDLVVGRLPVRDVATANLMIQKILAYEQAPPAGSWRAHNLFLSDRGKIGANPGEAWDFELTNQFSADYLDPYFTQLQLKYYSQFWVDQGTYPQPAETMRDAIKDSINGVDGNADGAAVAQYIGHGNFVVWSDDAFWDERTQAPPIDSDGLVNGQRLPWLMAHNCLTGGFHLTAYNTVGENLLKRSGGGAIGVFSPSGLSENNIGRWVANLVWSQLYGLPKEREVGVIAYNVLSEICTQGAVEACQNYVIQGDPAMRLALRSVDAAKLVQASPGDAKVDLTWSASDTAGATYDVYRNTAPNGLVFQKVNGSPIATTDFFDTTTNNGVTYYYYIVAVDPEGFESRHSNFNSDCDVDGPDCVKARPLNPNPPSAPTGAALQDPGLGTQLKLNWTANPEPDIAGYTVHYGTQAGVYDFVVDVGNTTAYTLQNLTEGQPYFVRLSATNSSDKTSDLSVEISDFPVIGLGLRAPKFIDDLTVRWQGADVVLEWAEVTVDIYGKPKTVAGYDIWRAAGFDPADLVKVGSCNSPCTSYVDPGAFTGGGSALSYRVQAIDGEGNSGGLGAELPGTVELDIEWSVYPVNVTLAWPAVTTAVDGSPTTIAEYRVYAGDQPFSRADIRDGAVTLLTSTAGTSVEITPPAHDRYYSVVAVDVLGNLSPF